MPKVTVLMSAYNGEKYLADSIESILNQTFTDFEFLIVNDASSDRSLEIIKSYPDQRIVLLNNECNLGLTKSLNRGIAVAQGEFIARQDADDISEPDRLEKQILFLERNPEAVLVGSWYKEIDDKDRVLRTLTLPCDSNTIRWYLPFTNPIIHSCVMFRKTPVFATAGLYDESFKYAQDWEFWSRIAYTMPSAGIANIDDYLVRYRLHSQSMTDTYGRVIDHEDRRIRTRNAANLLGWDLSSNIEEYNRRVMNMRSLFFKAGGNLSTGDLALATEDILELNRAFCQKYQLTEEEQKYQKIRIYFRVANANCEKDEIAVAVKSMISALELNPSSAFDRSFILLLSKIILKKIIFHTRPAWIKLPDSIRGRIRKMIKIKANIYRNH